MGMIGNFNVGAKAVDKGAADVFLEMITQPLPGSDGIAPDSSSRATV